MQQTKIAGVLFDMDGCLVDSESVYKIAWKKAFQKFALDITNEKIDSWVGVGWDIIQKEIDMMTQNPSLTLDIREAREDIFFQMLTKKLVHLMPGTIEMLEFVNQQKLVVGLATSTYKEKGQRIIDHFDLSKYFNFIIFGDEVENRKPAGDIYIKATELSNLPKEQLIVVEDSLIGCEAAFNAGLNTIWIPEDISDNSTNRPPTIIKIVPTMIQGKAFLETLL